MGATIKTLDRRHDAFVGEIGVYAQSCGCSFQGNPAYHDRLPSDQSDRLQFDYSAAGLAERLRCDKRLLNPVSGMHIPVEAKTSYRPAGPAKYLFEAYQIGLHKAMRDGCLYAIRKVCGGVIRDSGFAISGDFGTGHIAEIRIPDLIWRNGKVVSRAAGECQDGSDFYKCAFSEWFPGVAVRMTNTNEVCRGSGDPYAVMEGDYMSSLPDWKSYVYAFAYSHEYKVRPCMAGEWKVNETIRSATRHLRQARKLLTDERLSVYRFDVALICPIQDELYEIEDAVEHLRDRTDDLDVENLENELYGR